MDEEKIREPSSICSFCTSEINTVDTYCQHCGFPENGEQLAQFSFARKDALIHRRNAEANKKIKIARTILYILSGLAFLVAMVFYVQFNDRGIAFTNLILGAILVILGYWSKKEPLMALLMGLFLYITLIIISLLIEESNLHLGLLLKILVLSFLVRGVRFALKLKPVYHTSTHKTKEI